MNEIDQLIEARAHEIAAQEIRKEWLGPEVSQQIEEQAHLRAREMLTRLGVSDTPSSVPEQPTQPTQPTQPAEPPYYVPAHTRWQQRLASARR